VEEIMDFNSYQFRAAKTAIYPKEGLQGLLYTSLGLVSEAGEVAGKVKKVLRDDESVISPERHEQLIDELGDVLWYCAMVAEELDITLGYVATRNISKLEDRRNRNVIGGSGDNR
jgi:NTP pyrophosphatase (non-canonical NTP hydrolase)